MHIDINHLHKLAEKGLLNERRVGHTLLAVTYLASLVSVSEPVIYCFVDAYIDVHYIRKLVSNVFQQYELPRIKWVGMLHFTCNGSKVFFRNNHNSKFSMQGLSNDVAIVLMFNDPNKNFEYLSHFQE